MKTLKLSLILLFIVSITLEAQPPQAFKYKAIAKDEWGLPLPQKDVSLRFTIYLGSGESYPVYIETHQTTTTRTGLMDVNIGQGTSQLGTFSELDWGAGDYYIKIELDPGGGTNYRLEDQSHQLLSVPYALFAGNVSNSNDADGDPENELINNIVLNGTYLEIYEGNFLTMIDLSGLQDGTQDSDADPLNEIQDLQLSENILTITKQGSPTQIDLGLFLDNTDSQTLSLTDQQLSISNGNSVILTDNTEDADADPTNEIQVLSLEENILELSSNGEPVQIDLTPYLDNTDEQTLLLNGHILEISNGNSIQLPDTVNDADADPENELQELTFTETILSISDGNTVDLASLQDGVNDADHSPTNELQTLSFSGSTLSISQGNSVVLSYTPEPGTEIDAERFNWLETQMLVQFGTFIDFRDNTEYGVVKFGDQVWMTENMSYYIDPQACGGSPLCQQFYGDSMEWHPYGRQYSYIAAQSVCPSGWHLPTDEDWMLLELNMGLPENELSLEGLRTFSDPNIYYEELIPWLLAKDVSPEFYPHYGYTFWSDITYIDSHTGYLFDHPRTFFPDDLKVERLPFQDQSGMYFIRCIKDYSASYTIPKQ
jgi:hypothetical protein